MGVFLGNKTGFVRPGYIFSLQTVNFSLALLYVYGSSYIYVQYKGKQMINQAHINLES